jgi:hypothetical protein
LDVLVYRRDIALKDAAEIIVGAINNKRVTVPKLIEFGKNVRREGRVRPEVKELYHALRLRPEFKAWEQLPIEQRKSKVIACIRNNLIFPAKE